MTLRDKWTESDELILKKELNNSIELFEMEDEQEIKEQKELLRLNICFKNIFKKHNYKINCCEDLPYYYENFYHEVEKKGQAYTIEFVILITEFLKEIQLSEWNLLNIPNSEFINSILNGLRDYGYLILRQFDSIEEDEMDSVNWTETEIITLKNDIYFRITIS